MTVGSPSLMGGGSDEAGSRSGSSPGSLCAPGYWPLRGSVGMDVSSTPCPSDFPHSNPNAPGLCFNDQCSGFADTGACNQPKDDNHCQSYCAQDEIDALDVCAAQGRVAGDFSAFGEEYVDIPSDAQYGQVSFTFQCSQPASVAFQLKGRFLYDTLDSVFMCVDRACRNGLFDDGAEVPGPPCPVEPTFDGSWVWTGNSPETQVAAGLHTLTLSRRRTGGQIQAVRIAAGACSFTSHEQQRSVCKSISQHTVSNCLECAELCETNFSCQSYQCSPASQGQNDASCALSTKAEPDASSGSDFATVPSGVFCSKKQRYTKCQATNSRRNTQLYNPLYNMQNTFVGTSFDDFAETFNGDIKAVLVSERYLPDNVVQRIGQNLWASNSSGAKTVPSVCPNLARSCSARALSSSPTDCPRGYRRAAGYVPGRGLINGRGGGQKV